jgi:hypothetical protein
MNEGAMRTSRMPIAPTDMRAFSRDDLPLPPTQNYAGTLPSTGLAGAGPRLTPAAPAENGNRRLPSQKPFENYRSPPAVGPYALLGANTNNGTLSPYMAYVRPAEEQQQVFDRASNSENAADQPAPSYPPAFLNYGTYYPAGR